MTFEGLFIRLAQAAHEHAAAELRREDHERKLRQIASRRRVLDAQITALTAEGEAEEAEVAFAIAQETLQVQSTQQKSAGMAHPRGGRNGGNAPMRGRR